MLSEHSDEVGKAKDLMESNGTWSPDIHSKLKHPMALWYYENMQATSLAGPKKNDFFLCDGPQQHEQEQDTR